MPEHEPHVGDGDAAGALHGRLQLPDGGLVVDVHEGLPPGGQEMHRNAHGGSFFLAGVMYHFFLCTGTNFFFLLSYFFSSPQKTLKI